MKRPACREPDEPVVVSVPVTRDTGSLSLKTAEAIIRRAGCRPMSKEETKRFGALMKQAQKSQLERVQAQSETSRLR